MAVDDLKAAPAAADGLGLTEQPAWANSAWAEIISSTSTPIALIRVQTVNGPGATVGTVYEGEIGIGLGAGGSEVEVVTIPFANTPDTSVAHYQYGVTSAFTLPEPYLIPQGSRVSIRDRLSDVSNFGVGKLKIWYRELAAEEVVRFIPAPLQTVSVPIQDRSRW